LVGKKRAIRLFYAKSAEVEEKKEVAALLMSVE
jgi:hypothetical protein